MQGLESLPPPPGLGNDEPEIVPHLGQVLFGGIARIVRRVVALYRRLHPFWQTFLDAASVLILERPLLGHLPFLLRRDGRSSVHVAHAILTKAHRGDGTYLHGLLLYGLTGVVLAPLIEEPLNRGLPILLARWLERGRPARTRRIVIGTIAVLATLLFAWLHNPVAWGLPLPQLLFGAVAWRVAWGRGLRYSILMHFLNNLYTFAPFALYVVRLGK